MRVCNPVVRRLKSISEHTPTPTGGNELASLGYLRDSENSAPLSLVLIVRFATGSYARQGALRRRAQARRENPRQVPVHQSSLGRVLARHLIFVQLLSVHRGRHMRSRPALKAREDPRRG